MAKMNRIEHAAVQSEPLHRQILDLGWRFGDGNPAK
jgi:hypothetical protein